MHRRDVIRQRQGRMKIPAFAVLLPVDVVIPMLPDRRGSARSGGAIITRASAIAIARASAIDWQADTDPRHKQRSNNRNTRGRTGDSCHDLLRQIAARK
jgi:hypothetical protein